jgi:hypothetical protein
MQRRILIVLSWTFRIREYSLEYPFQLAHLRLGHAFQEPIDNPIEAFLHFWNGGLSGRGNLQSDGSARVGEGDAPEQILGLEAVDHSTHRAAVVVHPSAQFTCRAGGAVEHAPHYCKLGRGDLERSHVLTAKKFFVQSGKDGEPYLRHQGRKIGTMVRCLRVILIGDVAD